MYGYIYKTTNMINNKTYIGQHKSKNFDTSYYGSGVYLKKAIKKYGKNNFTVRVLIEAKDFDELNLYEIRLIKYYKSLGRAEYNIAKGGKSIFHIDVRGEKNPFYGKKHSKETLKKLSEYAKQRTGEKNPFYGKKMSKEHLLKTRRTGSKHSEKTKRKIGDASRKYWICKYCGDNFYGKSCLMKHKREFHKEDIKLKLIERNKKEYLCKYCGKIIKSKGNLTQHIRAKHDKTFKIN